MVQFNFKRITTCEVKRGSHWRRVRLNAVLTDGPAGWGEMLLSEFGGL
ncbi:hypothetical protein Poly51_41160 [Rubripirellula tenax]|uniref:Uncharacterized protein n=1 Tax=Rubripirellula tenax TaxID=2528015 RepID=A0A5C6EM45_9BACT|nr:hypothetical protein Poly51_41160 [Rubripirellula tenax]